MESIQSSGFLRSNAAPVWLLVASVVLTLAGTLLKIEDVAVVLASTLLAIGTLATLTAVVWLLVAFARRR